MYNLEYSMLETSTLYIFNHILIVLSNQICTGLVVTCSYLDGRHLSVTSPAEVLELQRVVAESHRSAVQRGSLLNLKLQVMEIREVVIRTRPDAEKHKCWFRFSREIKSSRSMPFIVSVI